VRLIQRCGADFRESLGHTLPAHQNLFESLENFGAVGTRVSPPQPVQLPEPSLFVVSRGIPFRPERVLHVRRDSQRQCPAASAESL